MEKKIWYFQLDVKNRADESYIMGNDLKILFNDLLSNAIKDNEKNVYSIRIKTDINKSSANRDVIMDIYESDDCLFGTLSTKKDHTTAQKREVESMKTLNIVDDDEVKSLNFELMSYFVIHYEESIISYIQTQGGPGITPLSNLSMMKPFKGKYTITTNPIVDVNVLEKVFKSEYMDKIAFTCAVPNVQCLSPLGISDKAIMELHNSSVKEITVLINTDRNRPARVPNFLKEIGENIKSKKYSKSKAKIKKDLDDEYNEYNLINNKICYTVTFEIDIKNTHDAIKKEIMGKILETYNKNKNILSDFISWN